MNIQSSTTEKSAIDQAFLDQVLLPYKADCRYLKQARILPLDQSELAERSRLHEPALWRIQGDFTIPASCYIDDTGHFNSVEFNICYNQLFYTLIAHLVQQNLIDVMRDWDFATFKRRQLSDFLITKFFSTFRRQINSDAFQGELSINKCSSRNQLILLKTTCAFYDRQGFSEGEVAIAVLNKPSEL
jgi:hypothetical protein